jgi:hypothetical protein
LFETGRPEAGFGIVGKPIRLFGNPDEIGVELFILIYIVKNGNGIFPIGDF